MTQPPLHLGIDLGTTNSTAALFDGTKVTPTRNAQGSALTPSVVRIDARGNVLVGARARKFLESDPSNTRAEFKRLMGTEHVLDFAASKTKRRPEELAAEVLKSLRADVRDAVGFEPEVAVISVPALFEVAQTAATSEAARLAGFARVEMIQEPVASAIAAGWSVEQEEESWLVYDLGGGTFDVTLLESKEGLLRVVGHDGDNFLGGRDFDARIVDFVLAELKKERGVTIDRADPAHAAALRKLRHAAEEAKIELARGPETTIALPELFVIGGETVDVDVALGRDVLNDLVAPLVERSIGVCRRLLDAHGRPKLGRIVLVGGPTAMPALRGQVAEALDAPFREGLDPMTLVAQGAAIYAATAHLDARPKAPAAPPKKGEARVWLQHPAVTPDLAPYVVGKLLDATAGAIAKVVIARGDGQWSSAPEDVDAEGTFAVPVSLVARAPNVFHLDGISPAGAKVPLHPAAFTIVHGVTISDPPLSRSIGVALANGGVRTFFERGSPLPMRRSFTLKTVETVSRSMDAFALRVPIVQGEFSLAHLCRLVGTLEIPSREVNATLPAGSDVEVSLELDRGGRLSATARVPALGQAFDQVAHLVAPRVPVEELESRVDALRGRTNAASGDALRAGAGKALSRLTALDALFDDLERDVQSAKGGDQDAAEKARRALLEIDGVLGDVDAELALPALEKTIHDRVAIATSWLSRYGTDGERKVLADTVAVIEKAHRARDFRDVNRQLEIVRRLGEAAYLRHPEAWGWELEHVRARVSEARDLPRAMALVAEGERALARGDTSGIERAVRQIWTLLPATAEERRLGHSSGVR
jgi:molecular chaperone DnaK